MDFFHQLMSPGDNYDSHLMHGMGLGRVNPYGSLGVMNHQNDFEDHRQSLMGIMQLMNQLQQMGLYSATNQTPGMQGGMPGMQPQQQPRPFQPTPSAPPRPTSLPYFFGGSRYGYAPTEPPMGNYNWGGR